MIELTTFSPGMSAAVTTMTATSRRRDRGRARRSVACASVERIVAPNQAPGKTRSSVYLRGAGQLGRALAPERRRPARPAGHDRPGLDDDRRGRLGPRRQVGHGPSSMATDSITGADRQSLNPVRGGAPAGRRAGVDAVGDDERAGDDDLVDPDRVRARLVVRGGRTDRGRVEDDEVRHRAVADDAAIARDRGGRPAPRSSCGPPPRG